jgi:two-component system chemotaxis response regulator CheY
MRRILSGTIKRLGYEDVVEAAGGREALEHLAQANVDLIVTDWIMPEMSGLDFVRAVRALESTRDVPILMVTANATRDHIIAALRAGVNGYIVKPFTADTLREKLEALLPREPAATPSA